MIGIMVYSYAVSSLSNYVQDSDVKTRKLENSISYLDQLKIKYHIKDSIYNKIMRFLKYEYAVNKIDNSTLLNELPISLRNEVMFYMFQDVINNFVFFKNFNNLDFINRVLLTLKPNRAVRNDILVKEGDMVEETIFVKNGILVLECTVNFQNTETEENNIVAKKTNLLEKIDTLTKRPKKNTLQKSQTNASSKNEEDEFKTNDNRILKILQIRKNEHFGDVLMFLNRPSLLRVRVKSKFADLFLMKKIDLANIARDFPDIFRKIYSKSVPNMDRIETLVNNAKTIYTKNQEEIQKLKKLEKKRILDKCIPIRLIERDNHRAMDFQKTLSNRPENKEEISYNEKSNILNTQDDKVSSLYSESIDFNASFNAENENKHSEPLSLMVKYINEINQRYKKDHAQMDSNTTESEIISENPSVSEEKVTEKLLSPGKIKIDLNRKKILDQKIYNPLDNFIYADSLKGTKIINNGNINIIHQSLNEQELTNLRSHSELWNKVEIISSTNFTIDNVYESSTRSSLIAANSNIERKNSINNDLNDIPEVHEESSRLDKISVDNDKKQVEHKISDSTLNNKVFTINKEELRSQTLQKRNTIAARQSYFHRSSTKQRASLDQLLTSSKMSFLPQNTVNRPSSGNLDQLLENPLLKRKKSFGFEKAIENFAINDPIENSPAHPPTMKTQVKSRQQKMFNEIQTNIINSNLNINDPGNFYKNWLQEIHNKQIEEKIRKSGDGEKISKRLDKLQDWLKDIE
jgi:hypothetical protein